MPIKASKISMLLMLTIFAFPTPSFATFLLCPSVQEAKNLLQGTLNLLRAARDNKGDVSKAEIPFANCHADRTMTNPGELISKEHYVVEFMKNGKSLGIVNASKYLTERQNSKIILYSSGSKKSNIVIAKAWLYKKVINGKMHGVISVK